MKIFEMNDPYFAIVVARNKEQCMEFYSEVVCDVEDKEEFLACLKELDQSVAIRKLANTVSEETGKPIGVKEAEEQVIHYLNDSEPTLLAADGSLF